jgi:hypothetical protein
MQEGNADAHTPGMFHRPDQRLHPAHRTADHGEELQDSQAVEQLYLHGHDVPDGHGRKTHGVRFAGIGTQRGRAGRAAATAQHTGANDEELVRVNRLAGANVIIPPARATGVRMRACHMRVTRQSGANQNRIVTRRGKRSQRLIGHIHMIECEARLGFYPRQRDCFGPRHPQWRLIAHNLLILKVAPDNVGVRCRHLKFYRAAARNA